MFSSLYCVFFGFLAASRRLFAAPGNILLLFFFGACFCLFFFGAFPFFLWLSVFSSSLGLLGGLLVALGDLSVINFPLVAAPGAAFGRSWGALRCAPQRTLDFV